MSREMRQASVQEAVAIMQTSFEDKLEEDMLEQIDGRIKEAMETSNKEIELDIERLVEEYCVADSGEKIIALLKVLYGWIMMKLTKCKLDKLFDLNIADTSKVQ